MANLSELVGTFIQNTMSPSGGERIGNVLKDLDAFAAAIPNQEVAAQVYAASLLAIEVDTPQERAYLADLAQKTGLTATVVQNIRQTLGVKV
ncbi:DUF533 domain-containing protein [uncultured Thiodictyon sp.]|jgi:uncharacterized membrane protein YebE (DUF533 family)|uniref:DUF533 domain-containing protein n=1 Tax=uncultured Thiodictyon sp. TaxID=1846217 RepID=UPI0025CD705B|nr:DUF533 domain-containing protein [uncultured Thiodictyon sp.]